MDQIGIINQFRENISDYINHYFDDKSPLSKEQKAIYKRLIETDRVLNDTKFKDNARRVEFLHKKFKISLQEARADIVRAQELFTQLDIFDPATGLRLLLAKIRKYETICENIKDMKSASKFMAIEFDVLKELSEKATDSRFVVRPVNVFLSGEEGRKQLKVPDYNRAELVEFIENENIDAEIKIKLLNDAK